MTYQEVLQNARETLSKNCKACPVCNGRACTNHVPGPGAKGVGDTAIRNYDKWQEIRVNMDTICAGGTPDTTLDLFGQRFRFPFFAGPVGAVAAHYSDAYDDLRYNEVLLRGCANKGIAAFTGDGINPKVVESAAEALKGVNGMGVWSEGDAAGASGRGAGDSCARHAQSVSASRSSRKERRFIRNSCSF